MMMVAVMVVIVIMPVAMIVAAAMGVVVPMMLAGLMGMRVLRPVIVTMTVMDRTPGLAFKSLACLRCVRMFDSHLILLAGEHRLAEPGWHPPPPSPKILRP